MTTATFSGPPRFAAHELGFLLAGREDASANRSRELLGIPVVNEGDELLKIGLSSLIARGYIEDNAEKVLPRNEAGLVGYTLGTASHWISILAATTEKSDLTIFVQGESLCVMVRRAPVGTYDIVPLEPGSTVADAVEKGARKLLDAHDDVAIMLRAASTTDDGALFVRRSNGSSWAFTNSPVFEDDPSWPVPDAEVTDTNREGAFAAIHEIVTRYAPA